MEMTDIQTNQGHRQTNRLTIIRVSSVEIGRTRNGKCTNTQTMLCGTLQQQAASQTAIHVQIHMNRNELVSDEKKDRKGNQAHRQTNRLPIIGVSLVAIGPTPHKRQRHANHATCGNKQHRGPTKHRMGRIGRKKCILNIMYLKILHRMCNLVAKSLTTSYGADLSLIHI